MRIWQIVTNVQRGQTAGRKALVRPVLVAMCLLPMGCNGEAEPTVRMVAGDRIQRVAAVAPDFQLASASGKYLAGRLARRSRDFDSAAALLSDALSLDPDNSRIRRQAFFSLVASGRIVDAVPLAREIIEENAGAPIANLTLAVEDADAGRFEAAEARLTNMPQRGMNSFTTPLLVAWLSFARGDVEKAVTALDGLSKMASFAALRNLHTGLIRDLAGNPQAAEAALAEAAKGTDSLRVVQAYGRFLERAGRAAEAKTVYEAYIAKNEESDTLLPALERIAAGKQPPRLVSTAKEGMAEVLFNLAGTLAQGRSTDLALMYGRLALRLRPDFPLAQVLLGGMLEALDRKVEALALYDGVNPASSFAWSARLRRAATLDELERTEEAIAELRRMAAERTDRADALIRLGDLLRAKKRFEEAVQAYSEAIARIGGLSKNDWSLLYARGVAYERSQQWPKAESDFLRALELSPEQPFVLNYLGYSWVDQGKFLDRAREMIERAVQLRPNDGYIVDSLGWVLYRLGDYRGAAEKLERAVTLRPDDPTINDHLGDAYWRIGRVLEARFQWRRALSLDPEKADIPQIEKKLRQGIADAPTKDRRS